jgi:hypothetical protein
MRRRAWRYLRQLALSIPALYPEFAAQVLRHYPSDRNWSTAWVASQIWGHGRLRGQAGRVGLSRPPQKLDDRAFPETWKLLPAPLLRLLEDATTNTVCDFAARCLRQDFPDLLRRPDAKWLARLGTRRLAALDSLVVEILTQSPELHQSRLRGLGLHDLVLRLLESEAETARTYAIAYARAHATDLPVARLVELARSDYDDTRALGLSRLKGMSAKELGVKALASLLGVSDAEEWARERIKESFKPEALDPATFVELYCASDENRELVDELYSGAGVPLPAAYLEAVIDHGQAEWDAKEHAAEKLGGLPGAEIGFAWVKSHIDDDAVGDTVREWIEGGTFSAAELDLEWLKGLALKPRHRDFAINVLSNRERVPPARLGLDWLLDLTRRPEESLRTLGQSALLEGFAPTDFPAGDGAAAGLDRLFALLAGANQPEAVRTFAATYLRVHHPDLNATTPEAQQLSVSPKLDHAAFARSRIQPLFLDARPDVRKLAVAVAQHEVSRWGAPEVVYAMADGAYPEVRAIGCELLLGIPAQGGKEGALPQSWLEPPRVFALAESSSKTSRETALTLVRRHYQRLGDAVGLGWLMESPDRDVRLAAVRLLWERHRPRATSPAWKPRKVEATLPTGSTPFPSIDALRAFLRGTLFGLPPGRLERRDPVADDAPTGRALSASIGKRRVVEVVRDLAVQDEEFAKVVVPVLEEFVVSESKGEWQACVAALAFVRQAHPALPVSLPKAAAPSTREGA